MASELHRPCSVDWVSASAEATEGLGEALGRLAYPDLVVALDGDLGSGREARLFLIEPTTGRRHRRTGARRKPGQRQEQPEPGCK